MTASQDEETASMHRKENVKMETLHDIGLSDKTSFKVGGTAKNYYIPDSDEDILQLLHSIDADYYILSGGSNILINDKKTFEHVISMEKTDNSMTPLGDGKFYIGASCRIQKVIAFVNDNGYGGFEELYGLPALFGGIVYMNAGIGKREKARFNICDFIVRVKCIDRSTKEIIWLDKDDCDYSYRHSVFMRNDKIILGAEISCVPQTLEESKERIKKRLEYCRSNQVWGKGCFGTCFCLCSRKLLKAARIMKKITMKGITVSQKNPNWITNNGKATFKETIKYIRFCKRLHKLMRKKIEREVQVWD